MQTEVIFRAAARIKGIKRHIGSIGARHPYIETIKADNGYRGKLIEVAKQAMAIDMQCVKSNFGTSEFIPLKGRRVVERTIAWLDRFSRLCRNCEQLLTTATAMAKLAFMMILPKHI